MVSKIFLLITFAFSFAQAAQEYRLNHVQCESTPNRFERLKIFPAVKDETRFSLKANSGETGVIEYTAEHLGLMGGDCHVSFKLNYETSGTRLYVFPQRSTLRQAGGYFAPCETFTADAKREFLLRLRPQGLELEGDDTTGLCGAPARSRVRLILDRI